ncbi:ABC-type lipoprotein release transport system permease subunit [Streptomyces sp. 3330]|uniref:FtsX-like permease family protein n=1 Tax=Streptomyces sp. 3330 TaxID=2817755 RepID=UPI002861D5AD|nr:FtsX-like permease family protein [Streptomyces sp. 3330]MDR6973735.1 ABC-type lipoprotein release transport system permease subunit [Streptomyces sp. 3330]
MKEIFLGLRLLLGSGRGNRVRFLLMAGGSAVGVCCLAMVLAIPGILAAQDGRKAARSADCCAGESPSRVMAKMAPLELSLTDPYGSRPMTRIFHAPGAFAIDPPPGLSGLPAPGEVFVSPQLREELEKEPGLSQLVPGRVQGLIGAQGLAHPDELYAYIGVPRDHLKNGNPVTFYGWSYTNDETVEPSTLEIVRFTLSGVVLLPLVVYLTVCARLSAAARARRLAALRLIGLSKQGVQRVNAAETVAAALLGAVLGLGIYALVNQLISHVGLPGFRWYPADGLLSLTATLVCLIGCPALAWFAGAVGARKAAMNPLAVRRSAVEKPPAKWGLLPLLPGLGVVTGYCVAGATGHVPRDTALSSILMPLAVVLIGVGLVLSLPIISRTLARKVARASPSLSLGLAMRRNEVEPGGALRVATGLVLLVYAASLAQGVLIELDQVSKNTSPIQSYSLSLDGVSQARQRAFETVTGVRGHGVVASSWRDQDAEFPPVIQAVIATCSQLRGMVPDIGRCVDGRPFRAVNPQETYDEDSKPGASFPFHLRNESGAKHVMMVQVPKQQVIFGDESGLSTLSSGDVVLPPSFLPEGFRPEGASLTLTSSSAPQTVRAVLDNLGGVDPTASVMTPGLVVDALEQITVVKTILAMGMVLGLVIGVAAYLVAATDRAVERRPQVTALSLLGARPRTLRAMQVAQVVLPLAVGLVLAVVTGKAAESSYLVTGGGEVFWDGAGVPLLLACALGVVVLAAVGSLPLIGRRIDPELIRRD